MTPKELRTVLYQARAFDETEVECDGYFYTEEPLWAKFIRGETDAVALLFKKTNIQFERIVSQEVYNPHGFIEDNLIEVIFKANDELFRIAYYYDSYESPLVEYLYDFHRCYPKEITITVWEEIKE